MNIFENSKKNILRLLKKYFENFGKILEKYLNQKFFMTLVRVLLLPSIIKAMVRASKSLMVGWWGGLFDYSVSPGPSFWNSELIKRGKPQVISLKNFGCGGIGWPVSLYCLSRSLLLKFWQLMFNVEIVLLLELSSYFWSIVWTFSTIKLFTIRDILLFKYWIIICLQKSNKYKYK